jgi:hypothetical protein
VLNAATGKGYAGRFTGSRESSRLPASGLSIKH